VVVIVKRDKPQTKIILPFLYDDLCETVFKCYSNSSFVNHGFEEAPRCVDLFDAHQDVFIQLMKRCGDFDETMIAELDITFEFYEHLKELMLHDIRAVLHQFFFSYAVNWKIIKNSPVRRVW
jgi:hypothetical protein